MMKHRSVTFEIVNMHAGIYSLLCANVDTFKILHGKKYMTVMNVFFQS